MIYSSLDIRWEIAYYETNHGSVGLGGDIKYTEYPGVDHGSWEPACDDPETIAWLLKQKRD